MAPEAPVAEETPEIIPAAPTLEQAAVAEVAPETLPAGEVAPAAEAAPEISIAEPEQAPAAESGGNEAEGKDGIILSAEDIALKKIPLKDRPKDETAGGVQLAEDEDISLRFPSGYLSISDETSECWNGLEPDMSIEDEDLRLLISFCRMR